MDPGAERASKYIGTGQKEQLPELSHTDYSIGLKLLGL